MKFSRTDESQTVRFMLKPASSVSAGEFHVKAVVSSDGKSYDRGFEVIEYPHIKRYHIYDAADATLKVINVRTPSDLLIGYVMGVGDQVPPAIEQLGAKVQLLTAEDLAWGDLSKFTAIVTGVRAYERRDDLRANNSRLLDYVFKGGTMIVQYNKFEFNDAQYGPYPAKVSANRVTDENAPIQVTAAHSSLLTTPNEIGDAAWKNWVQERGTYFLADDKDSRYHDVLQMEDNFQYNKGVKTGALVEAQYGKGRWVYVGLGLWRQLPVGTDGAYQILANLISLGKLRAEESQRSQRSQSRFDSAILRSPQSDPHREIEIRTMEVALTPLEFARRARALVRRSRSRRRRRASLHLRAVLRALRPVFGGAAAARRASRAIASPTSRRTRTRSSSRSTPCRRLAPCWCRSTTASAPKNSPTSSPTRARRVVCAHEDYLECLDAISRSCRACATSSRSKGASRRRAAGEHGSTTRRW